MAIVRAVKSGNWSDVTVWDTGALPTSADDVYSNTFTVTIDISPTILSISNAATTGVVAGGSFIPTNGITLNATISVTGGVVGTPTIASSLSSPSQASIVSPLFRMNASSGNMLAVDHSGNGTINLIGNITNNLANNIAGGVITVRNSGPGTINITGNVTASTTGDNFYGAGAVVQNASTGTINITGNARINAGGINGNAAVANSSTGVINLIGTSTGHSVTSQSMAACINSSTGTFSITGSAFAGTGTPAIINSSTGTLNHSGSCTANNGVPALIGSNVGALVTLTGPFLCSSNGTHPIYFTRWFWQNASPPATYYQIRSADLSVIRPLYTADSVGGNPSASNVRLGTTFGPVGELTGTMAVPPASSVRAGTPVDNTVGTAAVSAADLWSYPLSSMTTPGSVGARLRSVLTEQVMGEYLAAFGGYNLPDGGSPPVISDPYFSNVVLLLHMDGNNGSTAFTDSSSNAHAITVFGNARLTTADKRYGTAALTLDGTVGTYVRTPADADFALGTGDFTVECWCKPTVVSSNDGLFTFGDTNSGLFLATFSFGWYLGTAGANGTFMGTATAGVWQHIAVTRSGTSLRLFINGTQLGSTLTNSTNLTDNQLKIGYYYDSTFGFVGLIDEFRVSKVARYTANFTPPTAPFPDA